MSYWRRSREQQQQQQQQHVVVDNPEEFQTQVSTLIPAEIRMISGCHSEQTSADVRNCAVFGGLPQAVGKPGGACTSALLELLYEEKKKWTTFQDLLLELRTRLAEKGFGDQIPQLSSSRPLELKQTIFSLNDGQGTCRALLVGINYRGQSGELSGCHNDVRNVKRYLIERQGYQERNILMLLDDGTHILPTRQKIILGLKQLVAYSQPGDNVYFHYSGHGGLLEPDSENGGFFNAFKASTANTSSTLNKDYEETLYPVDHESAGQIRDFSLFHHFVQPMKAGVTVTCVLDCCHSGTVLNLPYQFQPTPSGEIRARQCMDSLSNLAFLYLLAGNADLAFMGGGVLASVAQSLESHLGAALENFQGLGMDELYAADQTDDAAFVADALQYFQSAAEDAVATADDGYDDRQDQDTPVAAVVQGEAVDPVAYDDYPGEPDVVQDEAVDPAVYDDYPRETAVYDDYPRETDVVQDEAVDPAVYDDYPGEPDAADPVDYNDFGMSPVSDYENNARDWNVGSGEEADDGDGGVGECTNVCGALLNAFLEDNE